MSLVDPRIKGRMAPIIDDAARAIAQFGLATGNPDGARALLRVGLQEHVQRTVQAYWTPFRAEIPGECVALYLEVKEPRLHWAEGYLSPDQRNWVFCFHERADGAAQLAYYADYETYPKALEGFFNLSSWYILTATDTKWSDVVYELSPSLPWSEHHKTLMGSQTAAAVQESLKKSTIVWLRWTLDGVERTMPVWFVLQDGNLYVLSGERQQTIPEAERIRECHVVARWKGKNARVAEFPASIRVLDKGPEWDGIAEKIAEKRLNIPGMPEDTARRWRDECQILEVTPRG